MNHLRYLAWMAVALILLASYVALDHFVLRGLLSPLALSSEIRGGGIIACLLIVSSLFLRKGLDDLRAQRARMQRTELGPEHGAPSERLSEAAPEQAYFVFRPRYVAQAWVATLVPLTGIALFWILHPGNYANVVGCALLFCCFVFGAIDRMRWSFVVSDAGFEWGGFIHTKRTISDIKAVCINHEYTEPILVFERKNTIRKDAFGARQVDGFEEFSKVILKTWQTQRTG